MRPECLSLQGTAYTIICFCKESYMIALWIHDDVFVCLFEAQEHVHHLNLSLDYDGGVVQDGGRGMTLPEYCIRIFGDVYGGEE